MCETALHEIFDGIGKMVADVLKLYYNGSPLVTV
jgi:hypothetical protein